MGFTAKRRTKNIALAFLRTIGGLSTEMTILGFLSSTYQDIYLFLQSNVVVGCIPPVAWNTIIQTFISASLLGFWIYYGGKHDYVDNRLVNIKKLSTGDRLYYFPNSNRLKIGTIIQIMKTGENGTSDPYAIGIVDSCDEGNDKLMIVKHLEYLSKDGFGEQEYEKQNFKTYFYYPHLRSYIFSAFNMRGNIDAEEE